MSTRLTIPNLDAAVKHKLRVRSAQNGRSMEAEAREILARGVQPGGPAKSATAAPPLKRSLIKLVGIWKQRGTTAQMMRDLRGER